MSINFKRSDFPEGFDFGVATSAYQIEGSDFGGCGRSQWDDFAATPGNVVRGEDGGVACDHYHQWEGDLDLIKAGGFDSYRFSTSWARVMPEGRGAVNQEGLDYYERIVDGLLERGIKPNVSLYHWELPSALLDQGGWRNGDIANWFADFTEVVMGRIGDRVHAAATFNEPWCVTWLSHFLGQHAPGVKDIRAAARAMHHVLVAHGKSVQAMRGLGMDNVGVVLNFEYSQPVDDTPEAIESAHLFDGIYNRWFLGGVFNQAYPEDVLVGLEPHLPKNYQDDFPTIAEKVDFLGVNYYTRSIISPDGTDQFPAHKTVEGPLDKTSMGWEIYPDGLHHFLTWADREYTKGLPIYITENGMASYDTVDENGVIDDEPRINFLNQHMDAVKQAIAEGVPVKGYYAWSLLDNYEWAVGYEKRFGLVHVDFDSLERTPKNSYLQLQKALS
ncbi:GH1 family beta-glucosidase [Leucothrix arctica]|uniref:GH1 family beta-glucosidase n=1 Tax=Leucothrix arctica TaxID=1481894 RepID=UPI001BA8F8F1|nr:GH1 family beta-glucosidase [Leucothrix arctica]